MSEAEALVGQCAGWALLAVRRAVREFNEQHGVRVAVQDVIRRMVIEDES